MSWNTLRYSENSYAYCPAVPCCMNTATDNYSCLPSIRSSHNCSCVSQWSLKYYSILQKSLIAYCSAMLVCLHYGCFPYVWQYSLVSLGIVILILLIQHVCECTQSSINPSKLSFRLRHHFWTWAGSRPNYLSSIVPLVYPTYPSLIKATASDPLFWKS